MDNELEKYLIYHKNLLKKKKNMEQFLNLKKGVDDSTWRLIQINNNIIEIKKNKGKTKNLENMLYDLTNQYNINNNKKLEYHKKIHNFNLANYEKKISDLEIKLDKSTKNLTNKINRITQDYGCYYLGGTLKKESDLEMYLKNILNQPGHRFSTRG